MLQKQFCQPFNGWLEGLFGDIFNEFHWSSVNQDALKEIAFILESNYIAPQQFIAHRWLSSYDVAQSTLLQLNALSVYAFSYLSKNDKCVYRDIVNAICEDVSIAGQRRLSEIQISLLKKQRTEEGKKRQMRLSNKLFDHRKWTVSLLGVYTAVLSPLKQYVCLFQRSECLVHKLQDEQLAVFRQFLALFVKPECFSNLSCEQLTDSAHLSLEDESCLLSCREMFQFVGSVAEKEMKSYGKGGSLKKQFLAVVQKAYIRCGGVLQAKLPLANMVLQKMSVLDPCTNHAHHIARAAFNALPGLVKNILCVDLEQVRMEEIKAGREAPAPSVAKQLKTQKEHVLMDSYKKEVAAFSVDLGLPSHNHNGAPVPVDQWWGQIEQMGKYPLLCSMATALLSCFHGPAVESSFSVMGAVVDPRCSRMSVSTYSAIQTVKYAVRASGRSAVECFQRKDSKFTPVNYELCRLMRSASSARKTEQKRRQDELAQRRQELSIKKKADLSKQKAKALKAEAEKLARLAHKRQQEKKLKALVVERKALNHGKKQRMFL